VTFAPLAARLPEAVPLLPTTTLPRPKVVGDTFNCAEAVVPVPDTGIVNVALDAVEVIVTLPLAAPADCGVNETLTVALCPAARVKGAVAPLNVNPVPVTAIAETVTLAPPEFVTVSECVCLFPTVNVPKSRLCTPSESAPLCCWPEAPVLTPWHPKRQLRPTTSNRAAAFPQRVETSADGFFRMMSTSRIPPRSCQRLD